MVGKRSSPVDWLDAGFALLSEAGESALTLESLCKRMGKTKGSFYHHFGDMDGYYGQLLELWTQRNTEFAIDFAEASETPEERLHRLDEVTRTLDHRLDQIIRRWADYYGPARQAVHAVDTRRLDYLKSCFGALGCSVELADKLAELEYLGLLGAQQRFPDLSSEACRELQSSYRKALQLLMVAESSESKARS